MDDYLNMNEDGIRTNKELVLLWDEKTVEPQGTIEWLKGSWFSGHHHIRIHKRMIQWNLEEVKLVSKMKSENHDESNVVCQCSNANIFCKAPFYFRYLNQILYHSMNKTFMVERLTEVLIFQG